MLDLFSSEKRRWKPTTCLSCANTLSWASFNRRGAQFLSTNHPCLCVFYGAILIDCNIFYCQSKACSKVGHVSWTIRSIWSRSVVLVEYVRGFPSLCCGYFKTLSELEYKSQHIILFTSDWGPNGLVHKCWRKVWLYSFKLSAFY